MPRLDVRVVAPEREVWSGEADLVVAKGTDGDVGIMPGHAPMLISLAIHPLRVTQPDGAVQVVLVDGGFLHVTSTEEGTRIDVLAEHAALPQEIDASAAEARLDELRLRAEQQDDAEAQTALAKALMRAEHGAR